MYFYLDVRSKIGDLKAATLLVSKNKNEAEAQALDFLKSVYGDDDLALKRADVTYTISEVSPQRHEEILSEYYERQDDNHEIKIAALVLSAGEVTPDTRLNRDQAVDAARLIVEPSAFPPEYSEALGITLAHLEIECEVNDDGEEDYYENIPSEIMQKRRLSRLEDVYWGCAEHYGFPPVVKGELWQTS